ncbi:uncharacterized protein LOC129762971 [Toxorhynchites rutilus septentrionalis]|uniref:uncharacterized protein LOC129762971 n=1 Tax=Toxorhynchites rutilus septentrionalis TaxID=329112 RepID=UPI0024796C21|nr:uncharacterized protein LOC129762971 [Toxorhynchites rutilus septentrionalis]
MITIILLIIPLTSATFYHDVSTNNGLLTLKLDSVKIKLGYDRIIHKINLDEIGQNINYIEKLANNLNVTDHLQQTIQFKIKKAYEKLTGFYPKRAKRGLINALGNVIKFIAGNPDQEDLDLINQNLEMLETNSNKIIDNQIKQVKINNVLQATINKVSKTIRSIKEHVQSQDTIIRKDLELINLILNTDILIKTLEDLKKQIAFSKSNSLNKNILSMAEKDYILKFLESQHIAIKFEDEIYKFVRSVVSLQNNHIIIIVKLPIIEPNEYSLMQLEPVNVNGTRIDTNIRYVAKYQQSLYEQSERCFICDNNLPVNDGCISNILTNQKAKCPMHKQPERPIIKEISVGTILIDTNKAVYILDSCGESQIISAPTIIETCNCTVTVQNVTFRSNSKTINKSEYLTPIFGKEIETIKQKPDIEEIHQMNIENLEEIQRLKLHMISSQTLGGLAIASTILSIVIILCIHRYKSQTRSQPQQDKKEDIVTSQITNKKFDISSPENNQKGTVTDILKDEPTCLTKSFLPAPRFVLTKGSSKSTEDA